MPFISICIPSYKRIHYLQRLLDSITVQTFRDFEVIVSDDSNDDSVKELLIPYGNKFKIRYFKNEPSLGTPANWNFGISKAEGEWIKIIHDDDWFATPESLRIFAEHTSCGHNFIFCAYANWNNKSSIGKTTYFPFFWKRRIISNPLTLLAHNVVGPPSVILVHRSIKELYDERMKWRVDMDFYVRLLLNEQSYTYIDKVLVNVGIGDTQVTNECFENPLVELAEGFLLLKKYGENRLKNIWVYDAWWRLLRNMKVTDEQQLKKYVNEKWPEVIIQIVRHLDAIPHRLLTTGVFSKASMAVSYLINRYKNL